MAAGSAFSTVPNKVIPLVPEFHNVITPSENYKKEYLNIAATSIDKYKLIFNAVTNTVRGTILTHYTDQSGGYYAFSWQSVPTYIGSGANITGRWIDESLKMTPVGKDLWRVEVSFEKDN